MARRRTRRRQRGGRSSRKRRRRRGGDGEGTCSTTSTAPSAQACNSPAAQKNKKNCISRGWNPVKRKAECVWTPKAQETWQRWKKRVVNIEGKKKSEAALAKYGLNTDGNKIPVEQPIVEQPTVEESHDSPCEDDDTFIRQGEGASGKPLCGVIRSRKAKIAAETDQDKKREMIQVVMKNCSKLGAQHCKKTCGKCPKKEVVSEQPPPQLEIEPEPEPEPIKPTGTCKGRKAKFDKKCVGVDDKKRCNNKKSCNWEEPTGGRSRRRRRRKRRKTRKGKRTKRRRRKRKRKRTKKR